MGLKLYDFNRSGKKPFLKILYIIPASRAKTLRIGYIPVTNSSNINIKMTDSVIDQIDMNELYYAEIMEPRVGHILDNKYTAKIPYCMALNDEGRIVMVPYHDVMGYDRFNAAKQYINWKKTKQPFYKFLEFKAL